jgi:hypothetical protein
MRPARIPARSWTRCAPVARSRPTAVKCSAAIRSPTRSRPRVTAEAPRRSSWTPGSTPPRSTRRSATDSSPRAPQWRLYRAVRQCLTRNAVHFLWSEEVAQYIKSRSRRYPGCAGHRAGLDAGGTRLRTPCRA